MEELLVGIDVGSTTVKVAVMDKQENVLFKSYDRHLSKVREVALEKLYAAQNILKGHPVRVAVTGSAGLGLAKASGLPFVQEVFATVGAVEKYIPQTDVVVELGGEDAKIIFFTGGMEERMNGSCAGGTGAFIDQMATLLGVSVDELDEMSARSEKTYSIASRCGVFAKSDIQPLLNQGANKEDIAASIFQAVVDQTVAGLAQGRKIEGNVAFLGGPLHFIKGLRKAFVHTLKLTGEQAIFPEDGAFFVVFGAALYAKNSNTMEAEQLFAALENASTGKQFTGSVPALFENQEEYNDFVEQHRSKNIKMVYPENYSGDAYLGIDAGSTTTKLVLITPEGDILYQYYRSNKGNPVDLIHSELKKIYTLCGDRITIRGSAVTGYGEELIQHAFGVDEGLVETVAHFRAAKHFVPDVDFILDIGGQDIKCFKIRGGAVDSIMLNEACSSGCGSFIETFAKALGYSIEEFAKLGLFAKNPVDLGSRCTVFMNSSVKQAQKEGAQVGDISAGLSMSVVKNALYKVIRAASGEQLGHHLVVQGGTFLNNAVLRSFEREIGFSVTRPDIAGIMGAYGAALAAKDLGLERSTLISAQALESFVHAAQAVTCGLCTNHCNLTVNTFGAGKKFISGNRCDKPLGRSGAQELPNLYKFKYEYLRSLQGGPGVLGKIGIPMGLNMYENMPFWFAFLTELGFEVVQSPPSSRQLYAKGQYTIPSDTVCYPAKLLHGQVEALIDEGVDRIFYPCMTYNFNEKLGDNHYNCPVVAYYPELIEANVKRLNEVTFYGPYFGLHRPRDFEKKAFDFFAPKFDLPREKIIQATSKAYAVYELYRQKIQEETQKAIQYAREHGKRIICLAGRPYHIDPEINHGIDRLISSLGLVVITEDGISHLVGKQKVNVLNQWTYHSRLYNAARYVTTQPDMELVQLVSFGCGIDAITADETRDILEKNGKLYTMLKIDEINNLGAVKIRLRSLIAACGSRDKDLAVSAADRGEL